MITLDRMAVEEAGPNPERMAAQIHHQLKLAYGAVPVAQLARALDIVDIRIQPLQGCEAALVMPDDRSEGAIAVNSASAPWRRNFGIGHELGHFLNPWHRPLTEGGFVCSTSDLKRSWSRLSRDAARHLVQEAEANRFAIELLAPPTFVRRRLGSLPDLSRALDLANDLQISKEAAARRYVELHPRPCALIFSVRDEIRYVESHPDFPALSCVRGNRIPDLPAPADACGLSAHEEADARDWMRRPDAGDAGDLVIQTLTQRDDYAMTLLFLDASDEADDRE